MNHRVYSIIKLEHSQVRRGDRLTNVSEPEGVCFVRTKSFRRVLTHESMQGNTMYIGHTHRSLRMVQENVCPFARIYRVTKCLRGALRAVLKSPDTAWG